MARTAALRKLFHQRFDKPLAHDQEWMREQFLDRPDLVGIDFDTDAEADSFLDVTKQIVEGFLTLHICPPDSEEWTVGVVSRELFALF